MNKEILNVIRPVEQPKLINDLPGDRIQGSMPKAVNVPPPPKPKKVKTKWEKIIQQKTFLEQFQHHPPPKPKK